jgi:hypothetical protein
MRTKNQISLIRKSQLRKTQFGMMIALMLVFVVALAVFSGSQTVVRAQGGGPANTEYFTTQTVVIGGKSFEKMTINGPSTPPAEYELQRAAVALPGSIPMVANSLTVPAYDWVFGCSSVSGAMIAGYYDRNGFPNIYTGPTDLGVAPLDNSVYGSWSDGVATYPNIPLAASHDGVDGRVGKGSIDDYWVQYGSVDSDPYITGSWIQHTWTDAIGDYMKTSQSAYGNTDGSTTFWNYTTSASPLTCADMLASGLDTTDGTYGRKLFYEARGYTVTTCYSQKTDNTVAGGFSYLQFKAEIDAGRPVMLNLAGHTIVGIGYSDPSTVYVHDTWDHLDHSMVWGTSYSGLQLLSVSIVNISSATPPTGFSSTFNGSSAGWSPVYGAWSVGPAYYQTNGAAGVWSSAKHASVYSDFTYQAKVKRAGCTTCSNGLVIRGKPTKLTSIKNWKASYLFLYTNSGSFSVWRESATGTETALKGWTASTAILKKNWNTLKVIASGSSLKFYINNKLVWSGSDSTFSSGQVGIMMYRDASSTGNTLFADWAKLTIGVPDVNPFEVVVPGVEVSGGSSQQAP